MAWAINQIREQIFDYNDKSITSTMQQNTRCCQQNDVLRAIFIKLNFVNWVKRDNFCQKFSFEMQMRTNDDQTRKFTLWIHLSHNVHEITKSNSLSQLNEFATENTSSICFISFKLARALSRVLSVSSSLRRTPIKDIIIQTSSEHQVLTCD